MKSKQLLVLISVLIFQASIPTLLLSQKKTDSAVNEGRFNFDQYYHSTENLYPEIDQKKIKTVRLSVKEITPTTPNCNYLFNPVHLEGNNISLADLLIWAIKERGIPAYGFLGDTLFQEKLSIKDLERRLVLTFPEIDTIIETDISEATSFLVLESSIIGFDDKVIALRPIGICPVNSSVPLPDGEKGTYRFQLFWVHFPVIMGLLSNHAPKIKAKGVRSTLDLFIKNLYGGSDISESYFGEFISWLDSDKNVDSEVHAEEKKFDTLYLREKYRNGIFVNPFYPVLNGNPSKEIKINSTDSPNLNPDFSEINCIRIAKRVIDLRDIENYPLYFPENSQFGNRGLADVLFDGVTRGYYSAFDYWSDQPLSTPFSTSEAESKLHKVNALAVERIDGTMLDTIISVRYYPSDIKYFMIKEIEVLDSAKTVTGSFPVSITPILEEPNDFTGRVNKIPLFEIPFRDDNFRKHLSNNYITQFTPATPESLLSFLLEKSYKTDTVYIGPVSLKEARRQLGIGFEKDEKKTQKSIEVSEPEIKNSRLLTIEVSKSDTSNYQLFYPETTENGLKNLFEILTDCIKKGMINSYSDNNGKPGEEFSYLELAERLELRKMLVDTDGNQFIVEGQFPNAEIDHYLFQVIKNDSIELPIAICPVWNYHSSGSFINTFWIYLSASFLDYLSDYELLRLNCEKELTYGDYFSGRKYSGRKLLERELSEPEIREILKRLKNKS